MDKLKGILILSPQLNAAKQMIVMIYLKHKHS